MSDQDLNTVITIKRIAQTLVEDISPEMSSSQRVKVFLPLLEESFVEHRKLLACKRGCHDCCYQVVQITGDEAVLILREVLTFPQNFIDKLKERLKTQSENANKKQSLAQAALNRVPCGFLSARGDCSIYHVRPLLCQGETSVRASDCSDPRNEVSRLFGPFVISRGIQNSLLSARSRQFNKPRENFLELAKAILIGLDDLSVIERYEKGENVFKDAEAPIHTYTEVKI